MKNKRTFTLMVMLLLISTFLVANEDVNGNNKKNNHKLSYTLVDTGQDRCFDNLREIEYPKKSDAFFGQDAQYRSCSVYKGLTMRGEPSVFGFNFADGRIKSYPNGTRRAGLQYVRCVRGKRYGENKLVDNKDGTVTDQATGLTWMKADSGKTMTWEQALKYAKNLNHAGYNDWRLPNVKELQSIVDYSRAPDARDKNARAAAIDPVFKLTETESWFWSNTTHIETRGGYYVCFGQGFSAWLHQGKKMNAHGAGAVRSDPKLGDPALYPQGKGPQGDEIRIYNYVRCVRGGNVIQKTSGPPLDPKLKTIRQRKRNRPAGQRNRRMPQRNSSQSFAKRFIQRLDKNKDGKVSKSEFDGPRHHFTHLDKNKDGFISKSEAPKRPPRRMR